MYFPRSLLAASALAGLTSAMPSSQPLHKALRRDDNCATGPGWAPVQYIGGKEGNHWCETHWNGDYSPINGFEVWTSGDKDGDHIAGIQFIYATGDRSTTYGHQDTSRFPSQSFQMKPGELIHSLILYGNGKGQYTGHIHIETDSQTFDAGKQDTSGIKPYQIQTGGGLLLGAFGNQGSDTGDDNNDIVNLGFLFINNKVDSVEVKDLNYDTSKMDNAGKVAPQQVNVGTYYNHANTNVTVGQTQQLSVTKAHTFSQSSTSKFGMSESIEFSAEIFEIGMKSTTQFSFEQSQETTNSMTDSSTTSLTCQFTAPIGPNKGIKATGTFANGTTTVPYSSTVIVHLEGGGQYEYKEDGELSATSYYSCNTVTQEDDDPNLANTATIQGPVRRWDAPVREGRPEPVVNLFKRDQLTK